MIKKYFTGSLLFTALSLIAAFFIGQMYGGTGMAFTYIISCLMLGVLEVSVSLDNAVVNASILKDMNEVWKKRFLTWGMAIAVFGMRLIFPLAIVSVAGQVNPIDAVKVALFEPKKYQEILTSVHMQIMAFGGSFLFMVFASHFIDHEKKLFVPLIAILVFSQFVHDAQTFLISAMYGLVVYLIVDGFDLFDTEDATVSVAKAGLVSFIYLEILDASFSFDGVIAAFAITNNFLIIMLGLSIGAMFVRSLTLMLVDKGALDTLKYLEDGAFWGIGWLVVCMFLSVIHIELGEIVVAGGAALTIALATAHSMWENKKDKI